MKYRLDLLLAQPSPNKGINIGQIIQRNRAGERTRILAGQGTKDIRGRRAAEEATGFGARKAAKMQINLLAVTVIESVIVKCLVAVALLYVYVCVCACVCHCCCPACGCMCVRVLLSLTTFVCVNLKRTSLTMAKNENLRPD